jgi:OOP family OmpA-OmpF porin
MDSLMSVAESVKTVGVLVPNLPSMVFSCAAEDRRKAQLVRKLRPFPALPTQLTVRAPNAKRRTLFGVGASFVLAMLAAAPDAHAQAVTGDFAVQRFDPAAGTHNYFTTRGVRMDGKMVWSAGFMANYSFLPFVVRSCIAAPGQTSTGCSDPGVRQVTDTRVIENEVTGDLLGTLTVIPRLQIALKVPVSWVKGEGINPDTGSNSIHGINAVGAGDPEVEGKFRLHGEVNDPFVVGAAAFVTAPLGHAFSKGEYIGDTLPSAGIRGIFDGEKGPVSFGANLAAVFRDKGTIGDTTIGSQALYSVAGGFRISPVIRAILDGFGTTRFSTNRGENTLELDGGFQIFPLGSPVMISLGAGTAVVEGVGVPKVRAFVGVTYALEKRDRDGDGIDDSVDQCPTDKEDIDGFEDADGCPDPDNDLDGIPDAQDKCPNQPEDQDGFEDRDGCPDPDNDKDGIPDVSDQCPNQPETKNGYKDDDGCPDEPDRDNDGVPDSRDKCPDEPEDTDGFQDTDGCPDPDNDNDGVPDAQDECIDEPGPPPTGCPDNPKAGKTQKPEQKKPEKKK